MVRGVHALVPGWVYALLVGGMLAYVAVPQPAVATALFGSLALVFLSCYFSPAPERAILIFIPLFPAAALVPQLGTLVPGINFETLVIPALAVAAAMSHPQDAPQAASNPFLAPVLFYGVVMLASAVIGLLAGSVREPWDAFSDVKEYLFFVWLAPIAFRMIWKREQLASALHLIALVTTAISLHGLWTLQQTIAAGLPTKFGDRAIGLTTPQPNLFGGFLALMVVLFTSLFVGGAGSRRERLLYGVTLAAAIAALLATLSRGAWLAALLGLSCLGVWRGLKTTAALVLLAAVVAVLLPSAVFDRVEHTFSGRSSPLSAEGELEFSTQARVAQWQALPVLWLRSPLLGHGFKSFGPLIRPFDPRGESRAPHSTIVEYGVEEGLIGLAAYAWLTWTLLSGGLGLARRTTDPLLQAAGSGLAAAVVCLVMLDTSGARFRDSGVMAFVWLLGGALWRMKVAASPPAAVPARGRALR